MATPPDDRLDQLLELVVELASGDTGARMPPSPAADEIDAVIVGVNRRAEELQAHNGDLEARVTERTVQLLSAALQAASRKHKWSRPWPPWRKASVCEPFGHWWWQVLKG